ncbi:MAG: hypothetical protein ABL940_05795 [Bacteroidia bacterium]
MPLFFKNPNDPNLLQNKQAVTAWVIQYALATATDTVTVTELPCIHAHDNCAEYTVLISVSNAHNETLYTLHKPLLYLRKHDIYNLTKN